MQDTWEQAYLLVPVDGQVRRNPYHWKVRCGSCRREARWGQGCQCHIVGQEIDVAIATCRLVLCVATWSCRCDLCLVVVTWCKCRWSKNCATGKDAILIAAVKTLERPCEGCQFCILSFRISDCKLVSNHGSFGRMEDFDMSFPWVPHLFWCCPERLRGTAKSNRGCRRGYDEAATRPTQSQESITEGSKNRDNVPRFSGG